MSKKNYLVSYTCCCGEYEFSGQVVLLLSSRADECNAIHKYFMHFYDDVCKEDCERLNHYLYNMGEVMVNDIRWKEITEAQAKVLHDLNIA